MKKILKYTLITLVSLVLVLLVSFFALFNSELKTINNIEQHDDYGFYETTVYSNYALDDLINDGGASTDGELTNYLIQKILKGIPINFNIPDFGCSTFIATTPDGEILFGRNYDLDPVPSMLVRTNPENGYKSISIANASIIGMQPNMDKLPLMSKVMSLAVPYAIMDGMNEKGLSIGVLLIKDTPTNQISDKPDITTTSMIRLVLDKAANVEEAIAIFEAFDMHASAGADYHFQIADASGNSAIIEYIDNEISIIRKDDQPMALTNFIVSEANYGFGKGQDRYEILIDTLTQNKQV